MREIVWQTLAALAAVHAGDVAHRDVKPENLLLSWGAAGPLDAGAFSSNHWPVMDMKIRLFAKSFVAVQPLQTLKGAGNEESAATSWPRSRPGCLPMP